MLTCNESSSSRPTGVSVNKVILVNNIRRNSLLFPFDSHNVVETIKSMRGSILAHYQSFLERCNLESVHATVECAYAWLLNWAKHDAQRSMPISPDYKAKKVERQKRLGHFFSAQKLNMRNAP